MQRADAFFIVSPKKVLNRLSSAGDLSRHDAHVMSL